MNSCTHTYQHWRPAKKSAIVQIIPVRKRKYLKGTQETPSLAHREGSVPVGGGQVLGHLRIHSQILNRENSVLYPVLRIRDPVLF
jgi:hypothetical protein